MHERQVVLAVVLGLFFSIAYTSESFAQTPQCNGLDATHVGTEGKDKIRGTQGDDVIVGLGGDDKIYGKGGNDVICGGDGIDKLYGNSGNDILLGEAGSDKLYGGQGIDTCDSTSDDKRVIGCETPHIPTITSSASTDIQKQIVDLQNQINNLFTGLISWTDIQGIPESLADGDDDTLANISCDAQQTLVYDGKSWVCDDVIEIVKVEANVEPSSVETSHVDTTCQGNMINFAGLSHGADLNDIQKTLEPFGVSLSAKAYGDNSYDTVIIYNSDIDNGKDSDLEVGIGNLAIIPDNLQKPSDSAKGGEQIYEFDSPQRIHTIEIVDIESDEAGTIIALDSQGNEIGQVKLPVTGNKDHTTLSLDYDNVSKLVIDYNSSGGLTNLCISENEEEPTTLECEENQILIYDGEQWVCGDNPSINAVTLSSLNCSADEITKWDGNEWICTKNETESTPISFHFSTVGVGRTEWVGTATTVFTETDAKKPEIIVTTPGEIKNLIVKTTEPMALTPPENETYIITLLKNGEPTDLTCTISNGLEMCENIQSTINVEMGDTIVLKMEATQGTPFAILRSSVLFSSV